jgi:Zn-dependent protease
MHQFVAAYRSIGISFLFALLFGIIGVIAFATLPRAMSYFSVVFGGIGCIVAYPRLCGSAIALLFDLEAKRH